MKSYVTITDQFCGAGGSSIGATAAGAEVILAINHWKLAVETHNTNFPQTLHDCADVSACNPRRYPSTDILITSPECTNHSLAKGVARRQQQLDLFSEAKLDPSAERSRATMWDVPRFAEIHRYNIIIVENVVDARHWVLWDAWLHAMDSLGYDYQCVYFNSMFAHPTPQSRDRLYVVFWKKGNRAPDLRFTPKAFCPACDQDVEAIQSWKKPLQPWGKYKAQYVYRCPRCTSEVTPYYYPAAHTIDWNLPAPRIGNRKKPLEEKTRKRIQIGLEKYGRQDLVLANYSPGWARPAMSGPLGTIITADHHTLLSMPPLLVDTTHGAGGDKHSVRTIESAYPTQTSRQAIALVQPPASFIVKMKGNENGESPQRALSTVTAGEVNHALRVPREPFLISYYGKSDVSSLEDPVPTCTTHDRHGLVVPTRVTHYLVDPPNEGITIDDCGFRMLQPHEIQRAMAFPESYKVLGTKRERIKQLGNAVTPPVMQMILTRCLATLS